MIWRILLLFMLFGIGVPDSNVYSQYCIDHTCGVQIDGSSLDLADVCNCTEYDIGSKETFCSEDTNTRDIIYYWKPPATCQANENTTLPEPIKDIDCSHVCPKGTYMDLEYNRTSEKPKCKSCPRGHYSIGGGIWFGPSWVPGTLPTQFTSSCYAEDKLVYTHTNDCTHWQAMGQFIESGNNINSHSMDSILEFQIDLPVDGYITFLYQVNCEHPYDHLIFVVDKDIRLHTMENVWGDWKLFNTTLGKGHHWLRWIFRKDISITQGKDKAMLHEITIMGVRSNDLQCLECLPGRYTNLTGQSSCDPCPARTFSPNVGSTLCEPCGSTETSNPGSSHCTSILPCTDFDYYFKESTCIGDGSTGTLTRTPIWLEPMKCFMRDQEKGEFDILRQGSNVKTVMIKFPLDFLHPPTITFNYDSSPTVVTVTAVQVTIKSFQMVVQRTNDSGDPGWPNYWTVEWTAKAQGKKLPPIQRNVPCVPKSISCQPGHEWDAVATRCINCPLGKANAVIGGVCQSCLSGHGTSEYVWHSFHWEELSPFTTACKGSCGTPGWRYGGGFLDSGAGHTSGAESSLILALNSWSDPVYSTLFFQYTLSCVHNGTHDSASLDIYYDQTLIKRLTCGNSCDHTKRDATIRIGYRHLLDYSDHTFSWTFHRLTEVTGNYSHQRCDYARVYDIKLLGGHMYGEDNGTALGGAQFCKNCPTGQYGINKICISCEPGKYNDQEGGSACKTCPVNTIAYAYRSSKCLECGQSTVAQNHLRCHMDCDNIHQYGQHTYNLSGLPSTNVVIVSNQTTANYYFSLCNPISTPYWASKLHEEGWTRVRSWMAATGTPTHVAIGVTEEGKATMGANAGGIPSLIPTNGTLQINFMYGSNVTCWVLKSGEKVVVKRNLATEITIPCSVLAGDGIPEPLSALDFIENPGNPSIGPCVSRFEWASKHGCPQCLAGDWQPLDGKCINTGTNQRSLRSYVWTKDCFGGDSLPADHQVSCTTDGIVLTPGAITGVVIVVFIVVVVTAVILFRLLPNYCGASKENRRLKQEYANLTNRGPRSSEDDHTDDSD